MAATTLSHLESDGIPERKRRPSSKVKTGCVTCRIRRVKCDETKPACQRCTTTGRTCDGYESIFRPLKHTGTPISVSTFPGKFILPAPPAPLSQPRIDVSMLSRYFTPKTLSRLHAGYEAEAQEVLRASVSEPAIRHAIISLGSLRESLEQRTPSFYHGLQQYNKALVTLAGKLSEVHSNCLRSTLLCCQLFISIELTQKDYASAAQHFIRGFNIMYDYHARPAFDDMGNLIKVKHRHLPNIDIFALKLFIPACRRSYEMPNISTNNPGLTDTIRQCRIELVSLAESTLRLLDEISRITSVEDGLTLLNEKEHLFKRIQDWYINIQIHLAQLEVPDINSSRASFLFLFHSTLKVIITMALNYSQEVRDSLDSEFDNMIMIAQNLTEVYGHAAIYNVLKR